MATLNTVLALASLVMQILAGAFLVLFLTRKKFPDLNDIGDMLARYGLWIGFILSLGGTAVSLYYSEVLGFAPCGLCWFQRIFLYPQAVLFGLASIKNDARIADYSIALSACGAIVSLYQHYLQMGGTPAVPCPATLGAATDCAQKFLFEFGYITFPLIGFSSFAFIIVVMLFVRERRGK